VRQADVRLAMERGAGEERQLVRVLTRSRDADSAHPVEVEVAQLVRERLVVIRLPSGVVLDDVEVGGRDSADANGLADQEEVVAVLARDGMIDDGTWARIDVAGRILTLEDARADSLGDDDERELDLVLACNTRDSFPDLRHFDLVNMLDLSIADAIAVDHDTIRKFVVNFAIGFQALDKVDDKVLT